jgi:hypothetical protein
MFGIVVVEKAFFFNGIKLVLPGLPTLPLGADVLAGGAGLEGGGEASGGGCRPPHHQTHCPLRSTLVLLLALLHLDLHRNPAPRRPRTRIVFVSADKGGGRGVERGQMPTLTSQKKSFSLDFFFQNFWLPSLKNT